MSEAAQQPDDQDESDPYQVMPDLDGDQFERLKEDIEANGVEYPIIVDGDIVNGDGDVIDGHHRLKAWVELGRDLRDIPKRIVDKPEPENYHRAFRANLLRRDLADGTKRTVVKQYLLEHPDRVGENNAIREIASDLGVSAGTVSNAKEEVIQESDGNPFKVEQLSTDEKKELVREYVDENPNESNREVAKNVDCDVSHVSVGNWRPEDDDSDDTTGLDTFTTSSDEEEKTFDILDEAKDGNEEANEQLEKFEQGVNTADSAKRAVQRDQRNKERREDVPELPNDEYSVILADPPWESTQASHDREIENHYRTMPISEIKEMDVPAADESVLYLWTTGPKLEESIEVLNAWGFTYTTCAVWDKQKIGLGYWFRNQHELILIGKRGSFSPPAQEDRVPSVISAERGEHSEKPDELHEIIESAFPNHEKIELFARDARDDWDAWGDEV